MVATESEFVALMSEVQALSSSLERWLEDAHPELAPSP